MFSGPPHGLSHLERAGRLAHAIPHMLWTMGPRGEDDLSCNARTLEYLGRTGEELRRRGSWMDAVHPEDQERARASWREAVSGGTPLRTELRLRRADGAYRWHLALAEPTTSPDGTVEWVGTLTDIHDRKLAELELRCAQEELGSRVLELARTTELAALVARAQGSEQVHRIALEAVREVTGAERASLLLADEDGVMRFRVWLGLSEAYRRAVEGHTPWSPGDRDAVPIVIEDVETAPGLEDLREAILAEGIRSMAFVPLSSEQGVLGKIMVYFAHPRRFAEHELEIARTMADHVAIALVRERERRKLREALETADLANRAKSDLVASISHELRTPLNAVVGYTDLLLEGIPEAVGERAREQVLRIRQSATQLQQIIDEILSFARLETGHETAEAAPVPLQQLLGDVRAVIEPLAREAGLHLRVETVQAPATVDTDSRKLRQILINLLGNAVKFTPSGTVALAVRQEEGDLRFDVADTGEGLSDEEIGRVFDPFWQGHPARGGAGLGLAISQRMAALLGGRIAVESRPGEGSTFSVWIPAGRA